jgi:shikimate dehydrogenase
LQTFRKRSCVKEKVRDLKRACVIGWPVEHSRSPAIHRYWLKLYGLAGTYEKEAVRPEDLAGFLRSLGTRGYAGAHVTLPHKEAALAMATRADQAAAAIGAANTLWLDAEGRLNASNTDACGFIAHLVEEAPDWNKGRRPVIVLGAGGAARALVHGLIEAGASRILLANRSRERAEALARAFGPAVEVIAWEARNEALAGCGLLVNATSLGMTGKPPLVLDLSLLPADAIVADIVYSPLETPLLAAARARGNRTVDGLGMLLHQAVPGFERWFGVRPEVTPALRAHVAATLTGQ